MKKLEMNIDIVADKGGESKLLLVFDENKTTEIFNALTITIKKLEQVLKQHGLITEQGVAPAEIPAYLEAMKPVVEDAEQGIKQLNVVMNEVRNSQLVFKYAIEDMIQEKIDEAWATVDNYYEMFDEAGTYNVRLIDKDTVAIEFKDGNK